MTIMPPKLLAPSPPEEDYSNLFSRGHPNDKRERMEFPGWSRIVVDLPLSSIYYRSSPSIEHIQEMAELHASQPSYTYI
jgi:hypothetical protein